MDPKPKTHETLYAAFANSPIVVTDPNGQDSIIIHLQRVQGDKNAKKAGIVLFNVTFYNVQNENWKKIEPKASKLTGSNEFNFVMPGNSFRGLNKMEKKDFYSLKYRKMATHEKFENTVMVQSGTGRGQYIHKGKDVNESAGCLLPCQESKLEYTHHAETDMSSAYSDVSLYNKANGAPSGALSRELLATMKEIFENAKSNNSMPEKEFGFLLTTKDITPFINAKIAPELAPKPTPNHRNTIKNEE